MITKDVGSFRGAKYVFKPLRPDIMSGVTLGKPEALEDLTP